MSERVFTWGHKRRFNSYVNHLQKRFGERIQKVTLDAGFTCPNRDGKIAIGGCTFCNNRAFNPSYNNPEKSIHQQIQEGIEFHKNRYRRAEKFIAYFQPYSNTYASLDKLTEIYYEALKFPQIIGISIGTRPDCVNDDILDFLADLNKKYYITVEYGIESCYNQTLDRINRGHTFENSIEAIEKTSIRQINVSGHLIFGLPGETIEMMMNEAAVISKLPLNSIKFHQLQILKDTVMEMEFQLESTEFKVFDVYEYIDFVIDFIEIMKPEIMIERFTGEVPPRYLSTTAWELLRNDQILSMIEKRLEERDTWQGKYYDPIT